MITGKDKGTGLGLSITQGIISQHNGNIHFNSEPKRTEFFINIPINSKKELDLKSARLILSLIDTAFYLKNKFPLETKLY